MIQILIIILLIFIPSQAKAKDEIITTIKPLYLIVKQIMGDTGEPILLIDGQISPHDFSLKPSHITMLNDAKIIFYISNQLETFLGKPLENIDKKTKIIALSEIENLKLLTHRQQASIDRHIWLSQNNIIAMIKNINHELSIISPENQVVYQQNALEFIEEITVLNQSLRQKFPEFKNNKFIVYHDGIQYFEVDYQLESVGSITKDEHIPASISRILALRKKAQQHNITCVLTPPQFNQKTVDNLIQDGKINTANIDILGYNATSYQQLMSDIATKIADCLSK